MRKIIIGADHGGVRLKDDLVAMLSASGQYDIVDKGTHGTLSVDYPNIAEAVGVEVVSDPTATGILVCGSGIGISIAANKVKGIRAALVHDAYTARMSRQHNDANIVCLGERVTGSEVAKDAVKVFLETGFEGGRHANRVNLISGLEKKNLC
jgi:ribose 5-phosphate isomerase B